MQRSATGGRLLCQASFIPDYVCAFSLQWQGGVGRPALRLQPPFNSRARSHAVMSVDPAQPADAFALKQGCSMKTADPSRCDPTCTQEVNIQVELGGVTGGDRFGIHDRAAHVRDSATSKLKRWRFCRHGRTERHALRTTTASRKARRHHRARLRTHGGIAALCLDADDARLVLRSMCFRWSDACWNAVRLLVNRVSPVELPV